MPPFRISAAVTRRRQGTPPYGGRMISAPTASNRARNGRRGLRDNGHSSFLIPDLFTAGASNPPYGNCEANSPKNGGNSMRPARALREAPLR